MRGTLRRQKGRWEASRHLSGQHGIVKKMKADRPRQTRTARIEATANDIANHGKEFVEILPLSRHFRVVTSCHEPLLPNR
jgi:hypothetical protein